MTGTELPPEPWLSFLRELDQNLTLKLWVEMIMEQGS